MTESGFKRFFASQNIKVILNEVDCEGQLLRSESQFHKGNMEEAWFSSSSS